MTNLALACSEPCNASYEGMKLNLSIIKEYQWGRVTKEGREMHLLAPLNTCTAVRRPVLNLVVNYALKTNFDPIRHHSSFFPVTKSLGQDQGHVTLFKKTIDVE